ncbi:MULTISPECIES: hypothetical protein [Paraburkholderia]|uniref:Uncharacterized protein n=1 Tax=Paraburkholderia madseniana TaxID=2599607 RepID=A0AAP5ESB9_9BURK|nr:MULTISPECIES: hypothetical protein [Paraburkholderia]MCX4150991.1 hypothetical protein [Paraburkholderia madseniana]MCX4176631.1 hypothetical protein [Paraburkholderia madseniana]MDN7153924.1 hypothetical protein [Paraburkholderia sp. WS6]MDQ6412806.1 hypothetical protein [Paraburkholderia madseniana]MDQ6464623.1 hypothetical protein [Paraburkholderia madseniana]
MHTSSRLLCRLAFLGTPWTVDGPAPTKLPGCRNRVYHLGLAFGWMSVAGVHDRRKFMQRTVKNSMARVYLRYAFTGSFYAAPRIPPSRTGV